MQGASALEEVLREVPQAPVKVFVVWEPILTTDWEAPSNAVLARVADRRAAQVWDKSRLISAALSGPLLATGKAHALGGVVWDTVAVYAPGVRWEGEAPKAVFVGGPVARVVEGLREHVVSLQSRVFQRRAKAPAAAASWDSFSSSPREGAGAHNQENSAQWSVVSGR